MQHLIKSPKRRRRQKARHNLTAPQNRFGYVTTQHARVCAVLHACMCVCVSTESDLLQLPIWRVHFRRPLPFSARSLLLFCCACVCVFVV